MIIAVEGIMPMFQNTVTEIVESISEYDLTVSIQNNLPRTTVAFQCDADDVATVMAVVKKSIRATDWGKGHVFNVRALS